MSRHISEVITQFITDLMCADKAKGPLDKIKLFQATDEEKRELVRIINEYHISNEASHKYWSKLPSGIGPREIHGKCIIFLYAIQDTTKPEGVTVQ